MVGGRQLSLEESPNVEPCPSADGIDGIDGIDGAGRGRGSLGKTPTGITNVSNKTRRYKLARFSERESGKYLHLIPDNAPIDGFSLSALALPYLVDPNIRKARFLEYTLLSTKHEYLGAAIGGGAIVGHAGSSEALPESTLAVAGSNGLESVGDIMEVGTGTSDRLTGMPAPDPSDVAANGAMFA